MDELNPQGDSQGVQPTQLVEPVQVAQQNPTAQSQSIEEQVDKLFQDKTFVDTFFARVGDGVAKIVDNQVDKRVTEKLSQVQLPTPSHQETPVNTVQPVIAEPQQVVQTPVVEPKVGEDSEIAALKQRLAEIEGSSVIESIKKQPIIQELWTLDPHEAERFISRAIGIARANNITPQTVNMIFAEGADITKDVKNQIGVLSRTGVINKPTNTPIVPAQQPNAKAGKYAAIAQHFYGKK